MNAAVCHCRPESDLSDLGHLIVTNSGKPEFVQVLSLLHTFVPSDVLAPLGASHRKSAIADLRTCNPTSGKPEVGGRRLQRCPLQTCCAALAVHPSRAAQERGRLRMTEPWIELTGTCSSAPSRRA